MNVQWNPRRVSAFADEIGDDLELQLEVLAANGVGNIELRGVWGKNVLELSAGEVRRVRDAARQAGVGFSAVGSPIGKFPLAGDFAEERERMRRALEFAGLLEAPYVRIFSWYIPAGEDAAACRGPVLDRLGELVALAETADIRLAHENERHIYGDVCGRVLDLLEHDRLARVYRNLRLCQLRGVRRGSLSLLAAGAAPRQLLSRQGRRGRDPHGGTRGCR